VVTVVFQVGVRGQALKLALLKTRCFESSLPQLRRRRKIKRSYTSQSALASLHPKLHRHRRPCIYGLAVFAADLLGLMRAILFREAICRAFCAFLAIGKCLKQNNSLHERYLLCSDLSRVKPIRIRTSAAEAKPERALFRLAVRKSESEEISNDRSKMIHEQ